MEPIVAPSEPIRVILGEIPSLTAAVLRGALVEAGMRVAETATTAEALEQAARAPGGTRATVVIIPGAPRGGTAECAAALSRNARLRVLVAVTSATRADLLELRLLGADVGRGGVVQAVRAAVAGSLTT